MVVDLLMVKLVVDLLVRLVYLLMVKLVVDQLVRLHGS